MSSPSQHDSSGKGVPGSAPRITETNPTIRTKFDQEISRVSHAEMERRAKTTEEILKIGILAGIETIDIKWPDPVGFGLGWTRFIFPKTRRGRRRLRNLTR